MAPSQLHPVKKREMTIFDMPSNGTDTPPTFSSRVVQRSSVYQRTTTNTTLVVDHHHYHHITTTNTTTTTRTRSVSPRLPQVTAHLRLREFTQNSINSNSNATAVTGVKHQEIALASRSELNTSNKPTASSIQTLKASRRRDSNNNDDNDSAQPRVVLLPPITSGGVVILRRPTVRPSGPVREGGDVFRWILKGRELKPFSFDGDLRSSRAFYASHYPILLESIRRPPRRRRQGHDNTSASAAAAGNGVKVKFESESGTGGIGGVGLVTEAYVRQRIRRTSAERRSMALRERNRRMEESLNDLEVDDVAMTTVLRHHSFDPVSWSWNRGRYAIVDE